MNTDQNGEKLEKKVSFSNYVSFATYDVPANGVGPSNASSDELSASGDTPAVVNPSDLQVLLIPMSEWNADELESTETKDQNFKQLTHTSSNLSSFLTSFYYHNEEKNNDGGDYNARGYLEHAVDFNSTPVNASHIMCSSSSSSVDDSSLLTRLCSNLSIGSSGPSDEESSLLASQFDKSLPSDRNTNRQRSPPYRQSSPSSQQSSLFNRQDYVSEPRDIPTSRKVSPSQGNILRRHGSFPSGQSSDREGVSHRRDSPSDRHRSPSDRRHPHTHRQTSPSNRKNSPNSQSKRRSPSRDSPSRRNSTVSYDTDSQVNCFGVFSKTDQPTRRRQGSPVTRFNSSFGKSRLFCFCEFLYIRF